MSHWLPSATEWAEVAEAIAELGSGDNDAVALPKSTFEAIWGQDGGRFDVAQRPWELAADLDHNLACFVRFTCRLGPATAVLPDLVIPSPDAVLQEYHLEGRLALTLDILWPDTREHDLGERLEAYRLAGVEHVLFIESDDPQMRLRRVGPEGLQALEVGEVLRLSNETQVVVDETNALKLLGEAYQVRHAEELGWERTDARANLASAARPIAWDEYMTLVPESKFERYDGGLVIGGGETTTANAMQLVLIGLGTKRTLELADRRFWFDGVRQALTSEPEAIWREVEREAAKAVARIGRVQRVAVIRRVERPLFGPWAQSAFLVWGLGALDHAEVLAVGERMMRGRALTYFVGEKDNDGPSPEVARFDELEVVE
jgi:hypothetical protein